MLQHSWFETVYTLFIADGFYLAVTQGNVTSASRRVYVLWLESDDDDATKYVLGCGNVIDPNSIITEVKLKQMKKNTYVLPEKQRLLVEKQLQKSVAGLDSSSDNDDDDDSVDDDSDISGTVYCVLC